MRAGGATLDLRKLVPETKGLVPTIVMDVDGQTAKGRGRGESYRNDTVLRHSGHTALPQPAAGGWPLPTCEDTCPYPYLENISVEACITSNPEKNKKLCFCFEVDLLFQDNLTN